MIWLIFLVCAAYKEASFKVSSLSNVDEKPVIFAKEASPVAPSKDAHYTVMTETTFSLMKTQPMPPPHHYSDENITLKLISPVVTKTQNVSFLSSIKTFTIASLQQYTNRFSQVNLIGEA